MTLWPGVTVLLGTVAVAGCVEKTVADLQAGTLLAVVPAQQAGEDSGVGAVSGLVLGVAVGGALGRGAGRVIGAAVGAAVGGLTGSAAESAAQSTRGAAYTVRLMNGQVLTIIQHLSSGQTMLIPGQSVIVRGQGSMQSVEAAG